MIFYVDIPFLSLNLFIYIFTPYCQIILNPAIFLNKALPLEPNSVIIYNNTLKINANEMVFDSYDKKRTYKN